MLTTPSIRRAANRWAVLAVTVVGGAAMAVIMALRGETALAIVLPVIIIGYGLTVTFAAGRSDVAALFSGREEDERRRLINLRAGATTANVLMLVLVCGAFYEMLHGEFGGTFSRLSALGGITYAACSASYTRAKSKHSVDPAE